MICFFGLTVMPVEPGSKILKEKTAKEASTVVVGCSTTYTICSHAQPDSFKEFDKCMTRNGCG